MAIHSTILAWRIPMDRGAWQATIHGVAKSQTPLSNSAHTCRKRPRAVKEKWAKVLGSPFTKNSVKLSRKPYGKTQMKISVSWLVPHYIGKN